MEGKDGYRLEMFDYFKMNCYNDKKLIEGKERYFFLREENWVKKKIKIREEFSKTGIKLFTFSSFPTLLR